MPEAAVDPWQSVRLSRVALMLQHPYLAAAIVRLPLVDASNCSWCPTCATDGHAIYVNPAFTATLSEPELMFVMAHELVHCILGHLDRMGDRDRFLWNVAVDYATNALLVRHGHTAPRSALLDERFSSLSAEDIYDRLLSQAKSDGPPGQQACPRAGPGDHRTGAPGITVKTAGGSRVWIDAAEAGCRVGMDSHLHGDGALAGGLRPDPYPTATERAELRRSLIESAASAAGALAGSWKSELVPATQPPLAWESLLAQFVSGLRRSDYRLFPPHRKHIHRGLFLPSVGVPGPQHLVVAVDTSGSMSDRQLSKIFAQIDHLRAATQCVVTLLQFDVTVHMAVEIDAWESIATVDIVRRRVIGRGGTDLRAPFRHVDADEHGRFVSLDAIIILTDGIGPVPEAPPAFPVLWVLTPRGVNSCAFGAEVRLPKEAK